MLVILFEYFFTNPTYTVFTLKPFTLVYTQVNTVDVHAITWGM